LAYALAEPKATGVSKSGIRKTGLVSYHASFREILLNFKK